MTAGNITHDRLTPLRIGRCPAQMLLQRRVICKLDERIGVAHLIKHVRQARLLKYQQAGVLLLHAVGQRTLNEKTE